MNQDLGTRPPRPDAAANSNVFRLEGEYWTIVYERVVFRLRDSAGLHYLAHLLRRPGDKVSAGELLRTAATSSVQTAQRRIATTEQPELARVKTTRAIRTAMRHIATHHAPLSEHLRAAIKTGVLCSYAPDPRLSVEWEL